MTKDKRAGRTARANKPVGDADFGLPSLDPCQGNGRYSIRKKAQTFALLCLAGLLSWFATPVNASEVPQLINYSGKLSGAEGEPLPTGDYRLSFSLPVPRPNPLVWAASPLLLRVELLHDDINVR